MNNEVLTLVSSNVVIGNGAVAPTYSFTTTGTTLSISAEPGTDLIFDVQGNLSAQSVDVQSVYADTAVINTATVTNSLSVEGELSIGSSVAITGDFTCETITVTSNATVSGHLLVADGHGLEVTDTLVRLGNTVTVQPDENLVDIDGTLHVGGNVTAAYFHGDGSNLSGLVTTDASYLTEGTLDNARLPYDIELSGNVTCHGFFKGDGSQLTNLPATTNASLLTEGTLDNARLPHDVIIQGNIQSINGYFLGDGSLLDNVNTGNATYLTTGTLDNARLPADITIQGNIESINGYLVGNGFHLTGVDAVTNASLLTEGTLDNARLPDDVEFSGNVTCHGFFDGDGSHLTNVIAAALANGLFVYANAGTAALPSHTFQNNEGTGMWAPPDALAFSVAGVERMRLTTTGNVGINTASPTNALHVVGDVRIDGALNANTVLADEWNVANLSADNITSGIVPVARGGTGVTTSTGTGNLVLSDEPTFQGQVTVKGNVVADYFFGNGVYLDGVSGKAPWSISSIQMLDTNYVPLDDTALSNQGGSFMINGMGFTEPLGILVGNIVPSAVTYLSSTQIRVTMQPLVSGSYILYMSSAGFTSFIGPPGLTVSPFPVWTTTTLANVYKGVPFSRTVAATSDSPVAYSLDPSGNPLPSAATMASDGTISGTIQDDIANAATYNFTVRATDEEMQNIPRNFSLYAYGSNVGASGGVISNNGSWRLHTFTTSGTFSTTQPGWVQFLLVGGGAGGQSTSSGALAKQVGRGGNGGNVLFKSLYLTSSAVTWTIGVGAGGSATAPGNPSNIKSGTTTLFLANGGANVALTHPLSVSANVDGTISVYSSNSTNGASVYYGGAGAGGTTSTVVGATGTGGAAFQITYPWGDSAYFAGGGGSGSNTSTPFFGGTNAGSGGIANSNGSAATGGFGGGGGGGGYDLTSPFAVGGAGGSGTVQIWYRYV